MSHVRQRRIAIVLIDPNHAAIIQYTIVAETLQWLQKLHVEEYINRKGGPLGIARDR